jgi:hypothetical protein
VKLGKNASDTCAVLSEVYGGEAMKKSSVFRGLNSSKRARISKSQLQIMFTTFFDIKGAVHFEFMPQSQTVHQAYHVEIIKHLCGEDRRKRHGILSND